MSRKVLNTNSKSKFSVSGFLLKTTISIPMFMASLLLNTGDLVINKSLAYISGKNRSHSTSESISEIKSNGKTNFTSGTSLDLKKTLGLLPYGPKIHIRK